MKRKRKELFSNDYMTLFSDGELGLGDGVGYIGSLDQTEVRKLFEALKKYYGTICSSENGSKEEGR